jgi:GWxTD domain-containing protein
MRLGAILTAFAAVLLICAGGPPPDPEEIAFRTQSLPPDLRLEVSGFQYLLTPEEIEDLLRLPRPYRIRRWIDSWWNERDPIYTSEKNEVRIQHEARVAQAREWFRDGKWPGWDQRGEVQIRYGTPAWRHIIEPDVNINGYDRPGELWFYPALGPHSDRRSMPSKWLPDTFIDAKAIDANFNAMLNDGSTFMPRPAVSQSLGGFFDMLLRFLEVLETHPAMFPSDFDFMKLPLYYNVTCFRGGEGVDRVDVNAQFVADPRAPEPVKDKVYIATAVVWDTDGNEKARKQQEITLSATSDEDAQSALQISQMSFTLQPDFYRVAVTVREKLTGRFASNRWDATCRAFDPNLAISDIICAGRIAPAAGDSPFNRGALFVEPHPMASYEESESIPVYFEVYNLELGSDGSADYTVSYRLVPKTPRPLGFLEFTRDDTPLDVASSFTSRTSDRHDAVHLTIGSENLWPGRYALEVTITDENSNAQVSHDVEFNIEE